MSAVVIGFDTTAGLLCIGVEGIQMGAKALWRAKALGHACTCFERLVGKRLRFALGAMGDRYGIRVCHDLWMTLLWLSQRSAVDECQAGETAMLKSLSCFLVHVVT